MDAIPLIDLSGNVWCYACGKCLKIHDMHFGTPYKTAYINNITSPEESTVQASHKRAQKCCECIKCQQFADSTAIFSKCCKKCYPIIAAEEVAKNQERENERQRRDDAVENSLKLAIDRDDAESLRNSMRHLSESYWCAGWLAGLEFMLWESVEQHHQGRTPKLSKKPAFGKINASDGRCLSKLSSRAGGWWVWDDSIGTELFVTLTEWKKIYKAKK
jgi:hypothetical protein